MRRQTEWLLRTASFAMLVIGGCMVAAGVLRRSNVLCLVGASISSFSVGIFVGLLLYWLRHPTLQLRTLSRPNEDMKWIAERGHKDRRFGKTYIEIRQEREARNIERHTVLDVNDHPLDDDDPLARAVNAAWRSGKTIIWNEGDPLP